MSYLDKEHRYHIVTCEDGVVTLKFNRPKAMNAVNLGMIEERNAILKEIFADPDVKIIITTGDDKSYCAGGDLKLFSDYGVKEARDWSNMVVDSTLTFVNCSKITIAMVAGVCLGGGLESVLCHDFVIAADNATFGLPEINVGIFPGGGATQRLPQILPPNKVKELIMLGDFFDANTALSLGIVNKVVPLAQLEEETMKLAKRLLKKPFFSLLMAKSSINSAWDLSLNNGLLVETHGWSMCFGTEDQKEGMQAFIEKRKPRYQGK